MTRKLTLLLLVLLVAMPAIARDRSVAKPANTEAALVAGNGATVNGFVHSVSGNLITLAGGLVTLDASGARVVGARAESLTLASIEPGALIHAIVRAGEVAANAPIPVTVVAVTHRADVTLAGAVQDVNVSAQTLTILGRTIRVTSRTTFANVFLRGAQAPTLADVQRNMYVAVEADAAGSALVASSVMLLMPTIERPSLLSGTVKSIASDAWLITDARGHDHTVVVNANTKILGSPKAGDRVEVVYNVDSSHAKVAVSIIKHAEVPAPVTFGAVVKAINGHDWVLTKHDNTELRIRLTGHERVEPMIRVGDPVQVIAIENADGTLTIVAIIKARR